MLARVFRVCVCAGSLWNCPGGQGVPERDYPEEFHLPLQGVRADGGRVLRGRRGRLETSELDYFYRYSSPYTVGSLPPPSLGGTLCSLPWTWLFVEYHPPLSFISIYVEYASAPGWEEGGSIMLGVLYFVEYWGGGDNYPYEHTHFVFGC